MKAELISIGTEILLGDILDTNANFVAQRLPALGIDLYYTHQIGDNRAHSFARRVVITRPDQ